MAKQTLSAQEPTMTGRNAEPMSDADGLRMMQRTEEARGCHHLARALKAGAEALDTLADPSVLHVTRTDAEHALALAKEAGEHHAQALNTTNVRRHDELIARMDWGLQRARRLLGLEPSEG
jgi:hypothetical protein